MASNSDTQSSIADDASKPPPYLIPMFPHFSHLQHGNMNSVPIMYPTLVPEQINRGPGIYIVPVLPFMGSVTEIPTNALIPLTYSMPVRTTTFEDGAVSGDQRQVHHHQRQQLAPQRRGIPRRFQIAFQLDIVLIIKLVTLIFMFNQNGSTQIGSRQRLTLLVFFASIIYLYQTGALTPFKRWVSRAMHRAAAPLRPPRRAARVAGDGQPEDDNALEYDPNHVAENEAGVEGGNHWWGIVKEIRIMVFAFITSLIPGFHNIDHN